MNILVVGGAGYIGSHTVKHLLESGYHVTVYDNLSEGHKEAVPDCELIAADIQNTVELEKAFDKHKIDMVMHFSAYAYVGESTSDPEKYYKNNVCATVNLLSTMRKCGIKNFIFSSSCAVYGNPIYLPIDENHPKTPINPYGATKLMVERILSDYHSAYGLNYMTLRYFNAAGAHPDGSIGESHRVETHLIPRILKAVMNEKSNITVFGKDYETNDGTCIRDYIHVCDLARAHCMALERLLSNQESVCVNIGTGKGSSVNEVIGICEKVTGKVIPVEYSDRRQGDPPVLVAGNKYAEELLGFKPEFTLIDCIKTAWNWENHKKY